MPSDLTNAYLSSSNGKKVSPATESTADDNCPDDILTVNVLIFMLFTDVSNQNIYPIF